MRLILTALFLINSSYFTFGQSEKFISNPSDTTDQSIINESKDSLYIQEIEAIKGTDKVLHAEPLYIDLIRDLGARKGEKEWNIGMGLTDNNMYDKYNALVEKTLYLRGLNLIITSPKLYVYFRVFAFIRLFTYKLIMLSFVSSSAH